MSNHMCKNLEVNWLKLVEVLEKMLMGLLWTQEAASYTT